MIGQDLTYSLLFVSAKSQIMIAQCDIATISKGKDIG